MTPIESALLASVRAAATVAAAGEQPTTPALRAVVANGNAAPVPIIPLPRSTRVRANDGRRTYRVVYRCAEQDGDRAVLVRATHAAGARRSVERTYRGVIVQRVEVFDAAR